MTDERDGSGWFAEFDPGDHETARDAIETGTAEAPADWPTRAVERGFADSVESYYERLHEVTVATARQAAADRERAADQQLVHAIRAADDIERKLT